MKIVTETEPRNLPALDISFVDKRIEKLLFNYRARNFLERWMKPNSSAGWTIVVKYSHLSFCKITPMNCRC